jgi:putative glutamine amidotransferase
MSDRPSVIGIPCDHRMVGSHPFHMAGEKYIQAVREGTGAVPLLIPVLPEAIAPAQLLSCVDGLFFTGSPSNVSPKLYNGIPPRDGVLQDEARDATTVPLLKAAIAAGVPVFCVCRGFQELNVALGGTLHQHLEELPGHIDHREDKKAPLEAQYAPAHEVRLTEGGLFARLLHDRNFMVNSLHAQGIDRIAPSLFAEAVAADGTIEAVSMPEGKGFLIGVQWHPEWHWAENPVSRALLDAFCEAVCAPVRNSGA